MEQPPGHSRWQRMDNLPGQSPLCKDGSVQLPPYQCCSSLLAGRTAIAAFFRCPKLLFCYRSSQYRFQLNNSLCFSIPLLRKYPLRPELQGILITNKTYCAGAESDRASLRYRNTPPDFALCFAAPLLCTPP